MPPMEPLSPDDPPAIGAYRLLRRLGVGGMGRVYLGRSAGGRTLAVKVVHPHFAADENFRARFAREVAAARLVGGAWTAPVLDADPDASLPWVATGYVAGPDLQRAVDDHGPLPGQTLTALAAGLAEALAAVHTSGLVHRDVKPSNVMLALDGPRLIDFGIARASDASAVLTATGVAVGSPGYMSPEQIMGGAVGHAGDVFSFGAVLAFAATGRAPFPGDSAAQLLYRVVHEEPELSAVPEAQGLRALIAACLAKDPAHRPTPAELARACAGEAGASSLIRPGWLPPPLVEEVSRRAVELLDLDLATTPPAPPPPSVPPAPTAPPGERGARRGRLAGVVAAVVAGAAIAGAGAFLLLGGGDGEPGADPTTSGTQTGSGTGSGSESPPPDAGDALPERYAGEWEGDITIRPGLPAGTMTIVLEPGRAGDEVGTATSVALLGVGTCVDRLTLAEVRAEEIVFDAHVIPGQSTDGVCNQGDFQYVIEPRGADAFYFESHHPDSISEGVLDRQD
jgi:eukaryotic-like serine/threonine-protein kinase